MPTTPMNRVIQHLLAACGREDGMTDGELLTRFLSGRDDAALTTLVRRHGPMVWGVCRRLLHSHQDAEDAFQATFLVLVQKAATLPNRETVGNWLYGVAHQTAVRMRSMVAKRGVREMQVTDMPEPATAEQYVWNDLAPVLDEELSRLPDKYRVLIVLCDLEGVTRKDVARRLGIPEGTAASRLAAARAMLAKRLAGRGVVLSGVLVGSMLSQQAAWAGVPSTVVASTIKAATLVAAGHAAAGATSPTVAALMTGVTNAMFMTKIKSVMVWVLLVMALSGGAGLSYQSQAAGQPKDSPKVVQAPKPVESDPLAPPSPVEKPSPTLPMKEPSVKEPSVKEPSVKEPSFRPSPVEKPSPKNTTKVPDVLTPAEAIKQREKGKVTVQFKVAAVEVIYRDGLLLPGETDSPRILLKDGNTFSVVLRERQSVSSQIMRLGIDPAKHFTNETIRVTGQVQPSDDKGSLFNIVVESIDQLEIVRVRRTN